MSEKAEEEQNDGRSVVADVKGTIKAVLGAVSGDESRRREGQAQREAADPDNVDGKNAAAIADPDIGD